MKVVCHIIKSTVVSQQGVLCCTRLCYKHHSRINVQFERQVLNPCSSTWSRLQTVQKLAHVDRSNLKPRTQSSHTPTPPTLRRPSGISFSNGGFTGSFGPQSCGPTQEWESGTKAACSHGQTQTGPGTEDGPAIAMIHIGRQTVDEGRVPGQVIGHTGCICTQGDGAEDPCGDQSRDQSGNSGFQLP